MSSPCEPIQKTVRSVSVQELKRLFAEHLRDADRLKHPEGIATGLEALDDFLLWGGLPKGALSLLGGALGTGVTSLWIGSAVRVLEQGRWVAWVNGEVPLSPLCLYHRNLDLGRFVSIDKPTCNEGSNDKLLWVLQELMSSSLFELIACDLGSVRIKEHQLRKLQAQAREAHVALVFLTEKARPFRGSAASVFSLIVNFQKRRILIERAHHRPTPHSFSRSVSYARFTQHTADRIGLGQNDSRATELPEHEPHPLPEASVASCEE